MIAILAILFATAFARLTREEFIARLGTNEKAANRLPIKTYSADLKETLPTSFDARTKWPVCFPPVRDQAKCGSCWAHGAVESLSWRQCIGGFSSSAMQLAPQWLVDCDRGNLGCNGGQLPSAWAFMSVFGVAEESCKPYQAVVQDCTELCDNGSKPKLYYAAGATTFGTSDLESAMYEIMTNGPLETAFSVYEDFESYTGGVYKYTWGEYLGGHAVMIVGWGEENGVKYWIAQNSWGAGWGENGFFRMIRGTNDCGFEGQLTAGPAGPSSYQPPVPKISNNYYTVFDLYELGMKQGTAMWIKDDGALFREEAYSPGTKVIMTGKAGVRDGHMVQYAIQGDMKTCMCQDGLLPPQNILQVPEGLVYEKSYWSGRGEDKNLMEYILSDYVYKTNLESIKYTFAEAAISTVATPWYITETAFGIDLEINIVIYDSEPVFRDYVFVDPCQCPEN